MAKAREEIEETGTKLREKAEDTGRQLRAVYDATRDKAIQQKDSAERTIHEHPFITTATAFGAGMIVAGLLNRRR